MTSIISESTASSTTTTEASPTRRVHVYLTDSDSEASEDSSVRILTHEEAAEARYQRRRLVAERESNQPTKRRKVAKQLYKPVWVKTEPDSHVKTYSVLTQWKPFPEEGTSYAKWNSLERKLELRNRHIDIYRVNWEEVQDYDFDERPDLHHPGCRFVDDEGESQSAESLVDAIERHVQETLEGEALEAHFAELGIQDDELHYFLDLFRAAGIVDYPEVHEYLGHFGDLGLDRAAIIEYLVELIDSDSDDDSIPDEVDNDQHYVSDLEDPEY